MTSNRPSTPTTPRTRLYQEIPFTLHEVAGIVDPAHEVVPISGKLLLTDDSITIELLDAGGVEAAGHGLELHRDDPREPPVLKLHSWAYTEVGNEPATRVLATVAQMHSARVE
jgi:hypothetical protein